ncbi:protein smoothened isoform X2 [Nasonia vitripennis]|nr:protein smoothened isoform X2 [Nasonia vitripennis]
MILLLVCLAILVPSARLELDHSHTGGVNDDNKTWSDLGPRHRIKDPNFLMDPMDYQHCKKPAKCVKMINTTCLGATLPYDTTSLDLMPKYTTQEMIMEKLHILRGLEHIPKCWAVVQPFLCSLFLPKCVNDTVDLPSQEMCKVVSGPCKILLNHTIWPNFIKCDNEELFSRSCKSEIRELKFNTSSSCLYPLVPTDNALAIFEGIDGCGTVCSDPLYKPEEEKQIHSFVFWAAGLCGAFTLFAVVTFLIDWRSANKYPALAVFYINCCFFVNCIGWLAQFLPGSREVINCRKDGTLRMSEPSGDFSCLIVFILVYYSLMAAMVWFVILTYTWLMSIQALGKIQGRIDKKSAYFHLLAWFLPLMLTATIMALGEIDGNHTTGICFVGYNNHTVRAWFVLAPVLTSLLIGGYFLSRGLILLIRLKISSQEFLQEQASSKIRETIVRMGLFSLFTLVAVLVTFYCHAYDFEHSSEWKQSFRDYIICSITSKYAEISDCKKEPRPSAGKLQFHLLSVFFSGILMSHWVWTGSTADTWMRFLRRTCNRETEEPVKLKKHKVIAQAFAKRKMFNDAGRLSISFRNTHEDPVGLNFDLNSVASQDFSSTWAAALPKLVTRRGALVGASVSSNRRNSTDSQYSFSLRRVSVESRRNSCDSQFALSISEMKAELKTSRVNKNGKRRKKIPERTRKRSDSTKRGRRDLEKSRSGRMISTFRRGSTTSQESQLGIQQLLSALPLVPASGMSTVPLQVPNMRRRAGVDEGQLALKHVERLLPFSFSGQSDSDENLSSEEKQNDVRDKDIDLEGGCEEKNNQDSENEDSQPEEETEDTEETKMLESEEICERRKSKISNKSSRSCNRNGDRRTSAECQTKYLVEDETLQQLLQKSNDAKAKNEAESRNRKSLKGGVDSSLSRSPDVSKLNGLDGQSNAREIATQTIPLDVLEMEVLKQSIDEIINSRSCSSKGTQISSPLKKSKKQPKQGDK